MRGRRGPAAAVMRSPARLSSLVPKGPRPGAPPPGPTAGGHPQAAGSRGHCGPGFRPQAPWALRPLDNLPPPPPCPRRRAGLWKRRVRHLLKWPRAQGQAALSPLPGLCDFAFPGRPPAPKPPSPGRSGPCVSPHLPPPANPSGRPHLPAWPSGSGPTGKCRPRGAPPVLWPPGASCPGHRQKAGTSRDRCGLLGVKPLPASWLR